MRVAGIDYDSFSAYVMVAPIDSEELEMRHLYWFEIPFRDRNREKGLDNTFWPVHRIPHLLPPLWPVHCHVAYIERGFGTSRRNDFELGRIQGALYAVLAGLGVRVMEVNVQSWKKSILGNGNMKKAEIPEAFAAIGWDVSHLPRPDFADALGIVLHARADEAKKQVVR